MLFPTELFKNLVAKYNLPEDSDGYRALEEACCITKVSVEKQISNLKKQHRKENATLKIRLNQLSEELESQRRSNSEDFWTDHWDS